MQGSVLEAAAAAAALRRRLFLFGAGLGLDLSSGADTSACETELEGKNKLDVSQSSQSSSQQAPCSPWHLYSFKYSDEEATSECGLRGGPETVFCPWEDVKASVRPGG